MSWVCAGCVLGVLCRRRGPHPWCPLTPSFPEINDWEGALRTRILDSPPSGKTREKPSAVDSSPLRTALCVLSKEGPQPRPRTWRRREAHTHAPPLCWGALLFYPEPIHCLKGTFFFPFGLYHIHVLKQSDVQQLSGTGPGTGNVQDRVWTLTLCFQMSKIHHSP